jgi:hypothetical protein
MSLSRPAEGWICSLQALTTLSTVERGFFGKSLQILSTTCSISQSCQEPVSRFREEFKKSSRIGVGICNQLRGPKSSGSGRNLLSRPKVLDRPRASSRLARNLTDWRNSEFAACHAVYEARARKLSDCQAWFDATPPADAAGERSRELSRCSRSGRSLEL